MKINADMMNLKEAPLFKNQTQIEGQREREKGKKRENPSLFPVTSFWKCGGRLDWEDKGGGVCVCEGEREHWERRAQKYSFLILNKALDVIRTLTNQSKPLHYILLF